MDAPRIRRPWVLGLTGIAFFMVGLDALVVNNALPTIHRDLGGSLTNLEWIFNAYLIAFAVGIIPAAALGDRIGRRRLYVIGLALFSLASAACALAPNTGLLIAFRALQGVGGAIVTPLSLTILAGTVAPDKRGSIIGLFGAMGGLAVASGPLIGGAITQGLSWHWVFWINVPVGLLASLLATRRLPESFGPRTRIDVVGGVLIALAATAIAWGLVRSGDVGWSSVEVVASLAGGFVVLAAFLAYERRTISPMLPLHMFRERGFGAANITAFMMIGSLFSSVFFTSQYFQFGRGYSPFEAGLRVLPWTATPLIVAPLAGKLSDRIGQRPLMVLGTFLQGAGMLWLALIATRTVDYIALVPALILAGVGISMALPTTSTAVLNAVLPSEMGRASGVTNTLQRFGGAFGVAIVSAVFAANGHLGTESSVIRGIQPALATSALLALIGCIAALGVQRFRAPERETAVASARRAVLGSTVTAASAELVAVD